MPTDARINSPKVPSEGGSDQKIKLIAFPKLVDDSTAQQLVPFIP